jgi:hypothetical protein
MLLLIKPAPLTCKRHATVIGHSFEIASVSGPLRVKMPKSTLKSDTTEGRAAQQIRYSAPAVPPVTGPSAKS